jgi:hypothetical protein
MNLDSKIWCDMLGGLLKKGHLNINNEINYQIQHRNPSRIIIDLKRKGNDYYVLLYIPSKEFKNYKP